MRFIRLLALFSFLLGTFAVVVETSPSSAAGRVTLDRPRLKTEAVVLKGRAAPLARVRLVRRTAEGWKRVAVDRAGRDGRYRVRLERPRRAKWVVRAVSRDDRSRRRSVAPVTPAEPLADPVPADVPPPADDACGSRLPKTDGTWWDCSFVDDFNGTAVDQTKWVPQDTAFSGMSNGPDGCFVPDPSLMTVSDGKLQLSAALTEEPFTCRSPFGDFTTKKVAASLSTWGKFNQAYGRFAFRAKMPETRLPGAHSTLWMYPQGHPYGPWPHSGEIDVAEWFSARPQQVYPAVHYVDGDKNVHVGQDGVIENVSRFHTYELEWTPTIMRFFYDGRLVFEHSWTASAPLTGSQPFDKPFTAVLTQAWGQLWNAPVAGTPRRHTMTVDWVRVWK